MRITSRTPEGDPNRCPTCRHRLRIEPSLGTRDGTCPRCGHLLWFRRHRRRPGPVPPASARELAEQLLLAASDWWGDPPPEAVELAYAVADESGLADVERRFVRASDWSEFVLAGG